MEKALVALCFGGHVLRGQQGVYLHGNEQGVFHNALGRARMHRDARDVKAAAAALKFSYSTPPSAPPSMV